MSENKTHDKEEKAIDRFANETLEGASLTRECVSGKKKLGELYGDLEHLCAKLERKCGKLEKALSARGERLSEEVLRLARERLRGGAQYSAWSKQTTNKICEEIVRVYGNGTVSMTERVIPTFEQAMQRYKDLIAETYNPPLTEEEKGRIKRACLNGDSVFLRCTFENKPSGDGGKE
jgi:hypothetical protein